MHSRMTPLRLPPEFNSSRKKLITLVQNNTIQCTKVNVNIFARSRPRASFFSSFLGSSYAVRRKAYSQSTIYSFIDNSSIATSRSRFFSVASKPHAHSTAPPLNDNEDKKDSLRDAVNKMQGKEGDTTNNDSKEENSNEGDKSSEIMDSFLNQWISFKESLSDTWHELLESSKPKDINKKIIRSKKDSNINYNGAMELMIIDEKENLTAWEKMERRLTEAPIIQGILSKADTVMEKSGAKKAQKRLSEIKEDAQETWETSQNPWVYRMSSIYDTVTAESEYAAAVRQLRTLDPDFTLEEFQQNAVEMTLPRIMKMVLRGEIDKLEPLVGESVHSRLSAEFEHRKKEGLILDDNILGIFNAEIVAADIPPKETEPILVMHYMCQQINCSRDTDGNVKEGREDEIKANSYLAAFQREYDEGDGALNWKIVDFRFNGAIAWI